MFKRKDRVIYPGHGLAEIGEIIEKNVGGTKVEFYKLDFLFKDMTILLPVKSVQTSGLRYLSDKETIKRALAMLNSPVEQDTKLMCFTPSAWNKRHKEYQLKIQKGNIIELITVYKDLMRVSIQKDLSFGEKKILSISEDLIVQEMVAITDQQRQTVLEQIRAPFRNLFFQCDSVRQTSNSI